MPRRVLLASRLPEGPDATAEAAARLTAEIGGELVLVYVAVELSTLPQLKATTGENPDELRSRMVAEIEARARAYLERNVPAGSGGVCLVEGDVAEQVTRVAAEQGADYLVIGTESRSALRRVLLGSTSQKILQSAPCPVLVVPARAS